MNITIARIGKDTTICYAFDELMRLLRKMDKHAFIDGRVYDEIDASKKDILWVGIDGSVAKSDLDEIRIDVKNGAGIITGANKRSVLIAVYRFMYELGCRFLRPGRDCEDIPERCLDGIMNVSVREKASHRHRSVCIEGGISYEHAYNMIEWLPKVGMNGYYVQFHIPGAFFKRYYNEPNPYLSKIHVEDDDIAHIWNRLEEEIIKRGLDYHATGHGWTCTPFGIPATIWGKYQGEVPAEAYKHFALVNGKRELWNGDALATDLCYSNKETRDIMTDAVVKYCKEHPAVNFLHFWLADGANSHCECEECQKMPPSDYYVMMLNELDEKLTAEGIDTKVVCLIYCDLLWWPENCKIKNPDRFVLMFAPIHRTYTKAFADFDPNMKFELQPYERNKLVMPSTVEENVLRLKHWQDEQLSGDSFDYDYHLMWDHYLDPGYYECARILHSDMCNLEKIGLHGMVSCQTQRAAFPTGLPVYSMAKALWNKNSKFEDVCEEYYTAAFGEDAKAVEEYMSTLSKLYCPAYVRGENPISDEQMLAQLREAKCVVEAFDMKYIKKNVNKDINWKHLEYHADFCRNYADTVTAYILKDEALIESAKKTFDEFLYRSEIELNDFLDVYNFRRLYWQYFERNILTKAKEKVIF